MPTFLVEGHAKLYLEVSENKDVISPHSRSVTPKALLMGSPGSMDPGQALLLSIRQTLYLQHIHALCRPSLLKSTVPTSFGLGTHIYEAHPHLYLCPSCLLPWLFSPLSSLLPPDISPFLSPMASAAVFHFPPCPGVCSCQTMVPSLSTT